MIEVLPLVLFGLLAFVLMTALCYRYVEAGLILLSVLEVWQAAQLNLPPVSAGGLRVYPHDIAVVILLFAMVLRLLASDFVPHRIPLVAVSALIVLGQVRGMMANGIATATNDGRIYFYFWFTALYFSTFAMTDKRVVRLAQIWSALALCLLAVGLLRAQESSLVAERYIEYNDATVHGGLRYLNAEETLILSQALTIALVYYMCVRPSRPLLLAIAVLFLSVMALQHRTVWVVAACSLLYVALKTARQASRTTITAFATAIPVLGFAAYVLLHTEPWGTRILASFDEASLERRSTFTWRVEGWKYIIDDTVNMPASNVVLGQPFGTLTVRVVGGKRQVNISSHNYYIEMFLHLGIIGVVLLLGTYLWVMKRISSLVPISAESRALAVGILALLVSQVVFYCTYFPWSIQGPIPGIAIALCWTLDYRLPVIRPGLSQQRAVHALAARLAS
jgi:hypothetical protein